MKSIRVNEDHRVGVKDEGIEYDTADLNRIIAALEKLDGQSRTIVSLQRGNLTLTIGGGNEQRYLAFMSVDTDEQFFNLVDPAADKRGTEVEIVTGGQAAGYPTRQCIRLDAAKQAATYFAEANEMNPSQTWDQV